MAETVDCEHLVFVGCDPERVGDPVGASNVARVEWVPLRSVPERIAAEQIWSAGTLVALLRLPAMGSPAASG
jgi:hypothetical protein